MDEYSAVFLFDEEAEQNETKQKESSEEGGGAGVLMILRGDRWVFLPAGLPVKSR